MTAYEVRISDWSSDVCSSDLEADVAGAPHVGAAAELGRLGLAATRGIAAAHRQHAHLVAVLLAEEGERAGLDRLFRRHEAGRSEEHTSELQSLMRISYAVFCLKTKTYTNFMHHTQIVIKPHHNKV